MKPTSLLLALGVLALALPAQRTFIVDAANGPGTSFTDLPPALAQARHGDVFLIRSGTYSASSTDKGVALLGQGGVSIGASFASMPALRVAGLPAGTTFSARRLGLTVASVASLEVQGCTGRVHLEQVQQSSAGFGPAATITDASEVTMRACRFDGGVRVTRSTLAMASSQATGWGSTFGSGPGMVLVDSRLMIADSKLTGGPGLVGGGAVVSASSGLNASGSQISLAATAAGRTSVNAGQCGGGLCSLFTAASAIAVRDSALVLSADVTFFTEFGQPPIASYGSSTTAVLPLPALIAQGGGLGGTLSATFASTPGDPFVVLLGVPSDPVWLLGNLLMLDPSAAVTLVQAPQAVGGSTTTALAVPNVPQLRGQVLTLQGGAYSSARQFLFFSNPVAVVFD